MCMCTCECHRIISILTAGLTEKLLVSERNDNDAKSDSVQTVSTQAIAWYMYIRTYVLLVLCNLLRRYCCMFPVKFLLVWK